MAAHRIDFPPASLASPDGVVAVGGRPDPETLKAAYAQGIFPWPHEGLPLLWFCPDPRFVLVPAEARLPRSLRKRMRKSTYEIRADTAFTAVIRRCAAKRRPGQRGTWITRPLIAGFTALHREGLAHSIEAWEGKRLVGGLYGISLGAAFFGESMFADAPDASKVCLGTLLGNLARWGFSLLDCQTRTEHLAAFGAASWPRTRFLRALGTALDEPTRPGPWALDLGPAEIAAAFGGAPQASPGTSRQTSSIQR